MVEAPQFICAEQSWTGWAEGGYQGAMRRRAPAHRLKAHEPNLGFAVRAISVGDLTMRSGSTAPLDRFERRAQRQAHVIKAGS